MKNGLVPERSTRWNNLENDKPLQPLNWSPKSDLFIILRQVKPGYPNYSVAKYETLKLPVVFSPIQYTTSSPTSSYVTLLNKD